MNDIEKYLDNKYNRKECKECEYKIICAGECEKTINKGE